MQLTKLPHSGCLSEFPKAIKPPSIIKNATRYLFNASFMISISVLLIFS